MDYIPYMFNLIFAFSYFDNVTLLLCAAKFPNDKLRAQNDVSWRVDAILDQIAQAYTMHHIPKSGYLHDNS